MIGLPPRVLLLKILFFKARSVQFGDPVDTATGLEGILSPDGAYLALIDASHEVLSVVSIAHVGLLQGRAYDACMDATVHRFSVRASPDQKKGTEIDKISEEALEHLLAFCWYPDSSRLVVAASGGSIYVLERCATWGGQRQIISSLNRNYFLDVVYRSIKYRNWGRNYSPSCDVDVQFLQGACCILP